MTWEQNWPLELEGNYKIFREYIKCIFPPLIYVVDPSNLIYGKTYHLYKRKKYAFNVFLEYFIIFQNLNGVNIEI